MRRMSQGERAQRWQSAQLLFGGPLAEIGQFRRQADQLMSQGRVGVALDLIRVCSELFETYRRSARLALSDGDRARLQATAAEIKPQPMTPEAQKWG